MKATFSIALEPEPIEYEIDGVKSFSIVYTGRDDIDWRIEIDFGDEALGKLKWLVDNHLHIWFVNLYGDLYGTGKNDTISTSECCILGIRDAFTPRHVNRLILEKKPWGLSL